VIAENYNETSLVVLPEDRILAVLRSEAGGHLATSFSSAEAAPGTRRARYSRSRAPCGRDPAEGRCLLVVYGERNRPFGVSRHAQPGRGSNLGPNIIVLAETRSKPDCGYPSSVEIAPGKS